MNKNDKRAAALRALPSVDRILNEPSLASVFRTVPRNVALVKVRKVLKDFREGILAGSSPAPDDADASVLDEVRRAVEAWERPLYQGVVNATGIVLHTGLGRAPFCREAVDALTEAVRGYSRLAFDLVTGKRKPREEEVRELLCALTGAESAQVCNNNAAGTMLVLNSVARGKEVICARGQLVEIGGHFRIPEVMEMSGARLREIGTTNRVHLKDYRNAISEETGAILKVHTSNYRILGFHSEVPVKELVPLGHEHGIPVIDDLGSGAVVDIEPFGLDEEPLVQDSMKAGVDLACFSADKLIGASQGGIILGAKRHIDEIRDNPLMRALRVDKMSLIVLEQTLKVLLDKEHRLERHTLFRLLSLDPGTIKTRAENLASRIRQRLPGRLEVGVVETRSEIGAGTTPTKSLPSWGVLIRIPGMPPGLLACKLRTRKKPVCGRVQSEGVILDLRTFFEGDEETVLVNLEEITA